MRSTTKVGRFILHISVVPPTAAGLNKFTIICCCMYFCYNVLSHCSTLNFTLDTVQLFIITTRKYESLATLWHIFLWLSSGQTNAGVVSYNQRQRLLALSFQFAIQCIWIYHNATWSTNTCLPEMKSPFFWNRTPCHWVTGKLGFVLETSGTKHTVTRGHGDLNCTASRDLKLAYLKTVRSEIMYRC